MAGEDAVGLDERLGGGLPGGGEAGPVGIGAGDGLDGGDHGPAQRLAAGQQRPEFLFQPGRVARAQHPAF